jgi:hypothetical protein
MLRIDRLIKPWREAAALSDHINLFGFWNERTFLTKSGDLGMVLRVQGVDYESLDRDEQEYAVKTLEAALKSFGSGFHIYQYLIKASRPEIPFAHYDDPVVEAAVEKRRSFFAAKLDSLYQVEIFYVVLLEGARSKRGLGTALTMLFSDPAGAFGEIAKPVQPEPYEDPFTLPDRSEPHAPGAAGRGVQPAACRLCTDRCPAACGTVHILSSPAELRRRADRWTTTEHSIPRLSGGEL